MAPDPPEPSGRLVLVFTAPNIPAGVVVKAMLETEGIPVIAKGESEGPYRLGPVYLMVPEERADEARRLLDGAEEEGWAAGGTEDAWILPDDRHGRLARRWEDSVGDEPDQDDGSN